MEKVRANLKRRPGSALPTPGSKQWRPDDGPGGNGTRRTPDTTVHTAIPICDLSPLRIEVDGALEGHKLVGQVNPRGPAFHNKIIQLMKKLMRRSLTWYTRPLHIFQGAVIRALQQTVVILKSHDDSLQQLGRNLNSLTSGNEQS